MENVYGKSRTNCMTKRVSVVMHLLHLRWKWCFHAPDRLFLPGWCFQKLIAEFIRRNLLEGACPERDFSRFTGFQLWCLKPKAAMVAEKEAQRFTEKNAATSTRSPSCAPESHEATAVVKE